MTIFMDWLPFSLLDFAQLFPFEQGTGVHGLQNTKMSIVAGAGKMYVIASMDRVQELKQEIAALAKLNALYKADSLRSEVTLRANAGRGLRLLEIRAELGAMQRPNNHPHRLNRIAQPEAVLPQIPASVGAKSRSGKQQTRD